MGITKIGPHRYFIRARHKEQGKEYTVRKFNFPGTEKQAWTEYFTLMKGLEEKAKKEIKTSEKKYAFFSGLMDYYDETKGFPISIKSEVKRIRNDCGGFLCDKDQLERSFIHYFSALKNMDRQKKEIVGRYDNGRPILKSKTISPSAWNRFRSVAFSVCRHAKKHRLITENPIELIEPQKEKKRTRILLKDEIPVAFKAMEKLGDSIYWAFILSLNIPMRRGDLINLKKSNVNLFEGTIHYHNSKGDVTAKFLIDMVPGLASYIKTIPSKCEWLFWKMRKKEYIHLTKDDISRVALRSLRKAGIKDIRWHDLRHVACTNMKKKGYNNRLIMAGSGWKTERMVSHYHEINLDDAVEEMREVMKDQEKKLLLARAS